jgi:hypothetical protein
MDKKTLKNHNSFTSFLYNYFNLFLLGVLILFFALAYWLLLGPKFQSTKAAIELNIAEQEKIYFNEKKKLTDLQNIVELYKKVSPTDLQKFNGVLPNDYVRERLFGELEEIVGRGGWLINSLEIIPAKESAKAAPAPAVDGKGELSPESAQILFMNKPKDVGQVYLELSLGSIDYAGLKSFLRLMENNLRLFDITSVDFSPTSGVATFKLTTYYYQPLQ